MPPTEAADEEALAKQAYAIFWEAIGSARWEWSELEPNEKTAWVMVVQFLMASKDDEIPDHK